MRGKRSGRPTQSHDSAFTSTVPRSGPCDYWRRGTGTDWQKLADAAQAIPTLIYPSALE